MKKVLTLIAIAIAFFMPLQAQDALTNKTIVDLKMAGLGNNVIKKMIANSPCRFEIDAKSLVKLKKDGLDDEIIDAIYEKGSATSQTEEFPKSSNPIVVELKNRVREFTTRLLMARFSLWNRMYILVLSKVFLLLLFCFPDWHQLIQSWQSMATNQICR